MALFEELAVDKQEVHTERGTARLWSLSPTVYVTFVEGHMDDAHAELFERFAERRIAGARGKKLHVFHDWLAMTGYESRCRQRMTSWSLAHLDDYGEVHLALKSKIVAMGVQVANIALGGKIRVYPTRVRLEGELRSCMKNSVAAPTA